MTAATDTPNLDNLQRALTLYRKEMREFIVRNLKRVRGTNVKQLLSDAAARNPSIHHRWQEELDGGKDPKDVFDIGHFPRIVNHHWYAVFNQATGGDRQLRNRMQIIAAGRNEWAHPGDEDMSFGSTVSYLENIHVSLNCVGATTSAQDVQTIISEYQARATVDAPPTAEAEPTKAEVPKGKSSNGLKPWREVVAPHIDVLNGDINPSTFAADLQEVADGKSQSMEYHNAVEFYNRSYITPGLKALLVNTVKRINGKGGDPVIQMKTGFGGGKTHSLIALYHLVESDEILSALAANPTDTTGEMLQDVFVEAGLTDPQESAEAKVAVLSGTNRSATEKTKTDNGDPLNTLWGHMAWQLGGQDAYDIVGEAARQWSSPGGAELDQLFSTVGPCVILIDELVAYARNLVDKDEEGRFLTFLQVLTESVRRNENATLVVTVPATEDEMGGQRAALALENIEKVMGRIENISAPLEIHEAFAVVRRRLFEDSQVTDEHRTATADAFHRMYNKSKREFPERSYAPAYKGKLVDCYPIHPEVFDRLFEDWSLISKFQRTRGVLRLMAVAIRQLYSANSNDVLIMPGSLPLAYEPFKQELLNTLSGRWEPAVQELDGVNSKAHEADLAVGRFSRYGDGAATRVARTIFFGSAPASLTGKTVTGVDEDHIRLGVTQPTEGVTVYNEARNRLARDLYHLHASADGRLYVHTTPNLRKVHQEVVSRIDSDEQDARLQTFIKGASRTNLGYARTIVFPVDSVEIPDDDQIKIIVLHPDHHLPSRSADDNIAEGFALQVLQRCGLANRVYKNTVVFVGAKRDVIVDLRREIREHMAWDRLDARSTEHNLSGTQRIEARKHKSATEYRIDELMLRAYSDIIVPLQPDPADPHYSIRRIMNDSPAQNNIAENALGVLKSNEEIVETIGFKYFDNLLSRYFFKVGVDHVEIGTIWEQLASQVYMPRCLNRGVLEDAIKLAVDQRRYEIADDYVDGGYSGLKSRSTVMDRPRLLVKADAAEAWRQLDAESGHTGRYADTVSVRQSVGGEHGEHARGSMRGTDTEATKPLSMKATRTLTGQAAVDGDYNQFRDDIIKALRTAGGDVKVTIEITGSRAGGFEDMLARVIRQNGEQLGFDIQFKE